MRLVKLLPMLPLCLVLFAHRASAQGCSGLMTPAFSSYVTYSVDSSNNIYSTVLVDGSANIHTSEYCSIPYGTTHKGMAYNKLGSTGGAVYGPGVCPSCYISVSNSQQIAADQGVIYVENDEEDVQCSDIGIFWSSGGSQNVTNVPLYSATCGVVNNEIVVNCGWGGPNTCCNPTIKASESYPVSGNSCNVNNCVQWTSGSTTYSRCCCSSVVVDSDCTVIESTPFCTSIVNLH